MQTTVFKRWVEKVSSRERQSQREENGMTHRHAGERQEGKWGHW